MTSAVVKLYGDFDFSRKNELEKLLARAESADVAVIDLRDVAYLDSSVLSCLASLRKRMSDRGKEGIIRITGAKPPLRRIFEICGLDGTFEFVETV